ncbi:sugar kinase [Reinekea marinisedimentorum]|uniref:2-dehydro-3-deoxygluconokinase n=1 Tax=Reinekea marinisedimentorum TaxID=230495 RepID=A0A4R3HV36_9GAMM|nr:sugar kinase [Reinekea marinisedimentorum]TCS37096.1 2-dehydro-3-deoxygluconokinase [Reinekea marinisedimentorum]
MKTLTFGEMMLRLKPAGFQRVIQTDTFEAGYGGAEANTAVSLALLNNDAAYLTKLPENALGDAALATLRKYGVDTRRILRGGPRLGMYVFEKGNGARGTGVVYDRAGSSVATAKSEEFNWPELMKDVGIFYFSGVTPAVSDELAKALSAALSYCKENQITVICDLNYRGKMWSPEQAQQAMKDIMPFVDVCIANDEDFEAMLGIKAFDGNLAHGIDQIEDFRLGMKEITKQYPNCKTVASVLRNIHSVEQSDWMAILYKDDQFFETPIHNINVMEGVAAGDAFGAGLIHGIVNNFADQECIDFAIAASVLKLSISGDLNLVTEAEIRSAMSKGNSRLNR